MAKFTFIFLFYLIQHFFSTNFNSNRKGLQYSVAKSTCLVKNTRKLLLKSTQYDLIVNIFNFTLFSITVISYY